MPEQDRKKLDNLEKRIGELEELRRLGMFFWKVVMWAGAFSVGVATFWNQIVEGIAHWPWHH